jgi:hypothetical protein
MDAQIIFGQKYILTGPKNDHHQMSPHRTAVGTAVVAVVGIAVIVVAAASFLSLNNPGGPAARQTTSQSNGTTQLPAKMISSVQSATQSSCSVRSGGSGNATMTITVTIGQPPPCGGCELVDSNSNGSLYVSTDARAGDDVCMAASLNYSDEVYLSVTNSAGTLVFSPPACVAGGPSQGDGCMVGWDTSSPDLQGNPIEPGTYRLTASDSQSAPVVLEANFTLS